ncbi:hypothetical protein EVAR_103445_1 [Eumeta japonica]|uniref:Uncharacterized protein n=1 Tax=Eumeta variegata TaxID=151549 RepID=A0A4C1Z4M0_EUMVA|nr:hypothetical protein EVAR_103445_1 [Eumeta japonica]
MFLRRDNARKLILLATQQKLYWIRILTFTVPGPGIPGKVWAVHICGGNEIQWLSQRTGVYPPELDPRPGPPPRRGRPAALPGPFRPPSGPCPVFFIASKHSRRVASRDPVTQLRY